MSETEILWRQALQIESQRNAELEGLKKSLHMARMNTNSTLDELERVKLKLREANLRKTQSDQLIVEAEKRASHQKRALDQQISNLRLSLKALEVEQRGVQKVKFPIQNSLDDIVVRTCASCRYRRGLYIMKDAAEPGA